MEYLQCGALQLQVASSCFVNLMNAPSYRYHKYIVLGPKNPLSFLKRSFRQRGPQSVVFYPRCSIWNNLVIFGICVYISLIFGVNESNYSGHGASGNSHTCPYMALYCKNYFNGVICTYDGYKFYYSMGFMYQIINYTLW